MARLDSGARSVCGAPVRSGTTIDASGPQTEFHRPGVTWVACASHPEPMVAPNALMHMRVGTADWSAHCDENTSLDTHMDKQIVNQIDNQIDT